MTFNTQARIANDEALLSRVAACAASLGVGQQAGDHPVAWAHNNAWQLAVSDGWADAYRESSGEQPGADETAVSDAMILDAVRRIITTPSSTE